MMCMPRSIPSSSTTRCAGDSRPSAGATPQIRKSGTRPAWATACAEVGEHGDAVGPPVEEGAGVDARLAGCR